MKHYLITALAASLFVSCEEKHTTINPPGKDETIIVKPGTPSTTEKKTETKTTVAPDGSSSTTEKKTTEQR